MSELTNHSSLRNKYTGFVPLICLLAGGGLIGISTNAAKVAGKLAYRHSPFCFGRSLVQRLSYWS